MKNYLTVLTIAGSDSSAGAGIQADIKAIAALGGYAVTVITAVTAQNTKGVTKIELVGVEAIKAQLQAVCSDIKIDAIKVGMLGSNEIMSVVQEWLLNSKAGHVVVDPVMRATSGDKLIEGAGPEDYKSLFQSATLITPNLIEASLLLNYGIDSKVKMSQAVCQLAQRYKTNVLLKGGHSACDQAEDVLYCYQEQDEQWFCAEKVKTNNVHGTGCSLSAAIATCLAQGFSLTESVSKAKRYLSKAILEGRYYRLGEGNGPINHFFNLGVFDEV